MLDKLQAIEEKYEQLDKELLEVGSNYQRAAEINKERVDLEPLIEKAREYRQARSACTFRSAVHPRKHKRGGPTF